MYISVCSDVHVTFYKQLVARGIRLYHRFYISSHLNKKKTV